MSRPARDHHQTALVGKSFQRGQRLLGIVGQGEGLQRFQRPMTDFVVGVTLGQVGQDGGIVESGHGGPTDLGVGVLPLGHFLPAAVEKSHGVSLRRWRL